MARAALVSSSAHVNEEERRGRCAVNNVYEGISYGGLQGVRIQRPAGALGPLQRSHRPFSALQRVMQCWRCPIEI